MALRRREEDARSTGRGPHRERLIATAPQRRGLRRGGTPRDTPRARSTAERRTVPEADATFTVRSHGRGIAVLATTSLLEVGRAIQAHGPAACARAAARQPMSSRDAPPRLPHAVQRRRHHQHRVPPRAVEVSDRFAEVTPSLGECVGKRLTRPGLEPQRRGLLSDLGSAAEGRMMIRPSYASRRRSTTPDESLVLRRRRPPRPLDSARRRFALSRRSLRGPRRPGRPAGACAGAAPSRSAPQPLDRELAVARLAARVLGDRGDPRPEARPQAALLLLARRREASISNTASTREAVTLACWPPGPGGAAGPQLDLGFEGSAPRPRLARLPRRARVCPSTGSGPACTGPRPGRRCRRPARGSAR